VPLLQVSPASQGDDRATFLAEFRALRDQAALDFEELAARAHYPTEVLKEAEVGPGLPGLPVLAAYVRACGGDVIEWEERWRRLASAADADAGLPVRPAGASAAAVAGARAGVTVAPAESHDPERIKAALRAHRQREEQVSRGGLTRPDTGLSGRAADPRNATAVTATMLANGNHHKKPPGEAFGTSFTQVTPQAPSQPAAPQEAPPAPAAPAAAAPADTQDAFPAFSAASRAADAAPAASVATPSSPGPANRKATPAATTTAQRTHAAEAPSRRASKAGHPGLLLLFVVLVLIGCVALLTFT
jgi:hypothetical protein